MAEQHASGEVKEIIVEAVVLRCGCGDPDSHFGQVCPTPVTHDMGVVAHDIFDRRPRPITRVLQMIRSMRGASDGDNVQSR